LLKLKKTEKMEKLIKPGKIKFQSGKNHSPHREFFYFTLKRF